MRNLFLIFSACLTISLANPAHAQVSSSAMRDEFRSQADYFCMKFGQISRNQLASFLTDELEKSPFPVEDYFTKPVCEPAGYGGNIRAPMLHLAIDLPITRLGFAEVMYKYYTIRRKKPELWLATVNAKNSLGETFLDYIETRINKGAYTVPETLEAAKATRAFICSKGAEYSKYKNKTCGE